MRDIDLTSLRLFDAVCNHGNISRVAESANIVGSAISKRLSQLEHATGTVLLKRVQKDMVPTAAGEALLEHARMLLAQADNMERKLLGYSSPANEVSCG